LISPGIVVPVGCRVKKWKHKPQKRLAFKHIFRKKYPYLTSDEKEINFLFSFCKRKDSEKPVFATV
jgi:hypothetical protein